MQEIVNEGWVKLHRKILKSDMWKSITAMQRDLVITVMLKANHQPRRWEWEGKVYTCKAGEFITSIDSLRKPCAKGTSVQNVRTGLKKLEKWEFLTSQATKTGRKICIINWATYQIEEDEANIDTNRQPTDSQQTANRQLTPNKNVKNEKNDKEVKHIYGKYKNVKFTDKQLGTLKTEFPNDWQERIDKVSGYVESKGIKQYSNNLATIRNWAKKDKEKEVKDNGTQKYIDAGLIKSSDSERH